MTVYVIEPDTISPASRFGSWLEESSIHCVRLPMPSHHDVVQRIVTQLEAGDTTGIDGIIHCGGRQNAYSVAEHPWISDSMRLYEQCIRHDIPVLGICLGHQILARTFGGTVDLSSKVHAEEGAVTITLTDDGAHDPQLARLMDLPAPIIAYESHHDYVSRIPDGAVLLARSEKCPVEAFRYHSAVGIQFHPEASPTEIDTWIESEFPEQLWDVKKKAARAVDKQLLATGWALFEGFVERVRAHNDKRHN